uniref:Alternative protein CNTNAP1 n=1 Tax=Homo sapiens TaxID=9606 RepID=L8E7H9_HUMAN|nr:alternative protein CNTNAP1 [Homo sapiens]
MCGWNSTHPGMWSSPLMWGMGMRTSQYTQTTLSSMMTSGTWSGLKST